MSAIIPSQRIERHILLLRGQRVMLSPHLAELYEVEPRTLIQAVKRNFERFPADFMFQLTWEEAESLRSQSVILDVGPKGRLRSQSVTLDVGSGSRQNQHSGASDAPGTASRSQSVTLNARGYGRPRSRSVILMFHFGISSPGTRPQPPTPNTQHRFPIPSSPIPNNRTPITEHRLPRSPIGFRTGRGLGVRPQFSIVSACPFLARTRDAPGQVVTASHWPVAAAYPPASSGGSSGEGGSSGGQFRGRLTRLLAVLSAAIRVIRGRNPA